MIRFLMLLFALVAGLPAATSSTAGAVGYIPINGPIDQGRAAYFKRALDAAKERKLDTVVVHLTTDGGELDSGRNMMNAALTMPASMRLVAFVDHRAYSAGSLIAYGHHEILLTREATIGDIGVISMKQDGSIEYAPEKVETVVRALLRSAAQARGWDEAKLQKMTARNQELYRFDLPEGQRFVLEDDVPAFLAAHPGTSSGAKVLILGKDRLRSYTAQEAVNDGMATAIVGDLAAVYARLGVDRAAVTDLSPSRTETVAWTLATFAPLLAGLAVVLLILEFKMPSGGLWLIGAAACGIGFFVCQFYLDLAGNFEVVLIILGIALVIADLIWLPTGGWVAMIGAGLVMIALILSFMPNANQFNPGSVDWTQDLITALSQSSFALLAATLGVVMAIIYLPKLALRSGLADAAAIDGTSAGSLEQESLAGHTAITLSELVPAGRIRLDDGREVDAQADSGNFIAKGQAVVVVAVRYGDVVVRKA